MSSLRAVVLGEKTPLVIPDELFLVFQLSDIEIVALEQHPHKLFDVLSNNEADIAVCPMDELSYPLTNGLKVVALLASKHQTGLSFSKHLAVVAKQGNDEVARLFDDVDIRNSWGEVFIAGFGPGDPSLITRKTENCLTHADVIVYDDLIDAEYLNLFSAEKRYVGKRKGAHYSQQDEINELMYQLAISGQKVVRLKGGDPLIFGRGAEEYHFLTARQVKASIIPGISSAMGAAANAIVPLTARGVSSNVAFLSGHNLDKISIPKVDTLVFYMGASTQKQLALRLHHEGWSANTPVAVIRNASCPGEEVRRYTLASLANEKQPLASPLIIIVGYSAAADPTQLPDKWLFTGINATDFKEDGVCVHSPMITIEPLELTAVQKQMIRNVDCFDRIIFTSRHAVDIFFKHLYDSGLDARKLAGVAITAIGVSTSEALKEKGILALPLTNDESSDGVVGWFRQRNITGENILIPRSSYGLGLMADGLQSVGNQVSVLILYNTLMPECAIRHNLDEFHGVVFTSPSTVDHFIKFYGNIPTHLKVKARGLQTQKRLSEYVVSNEEFAYVDIE
jgi:uroporphyrinogen III methyltransferase/synthase